MTIRDETKRIHEILGELRFDDGNGDPKIGTEDGMPYWLARPRGWLSDGIELLLSGNSLEPAPDSLRRAIRVFHSLDSIEKEGKDLIRPIIKNTASPEAHAIQDEARLLYIDCQTEAIIAVFTWDGLPYVSWEAILNEENRIVDLQETF